MEIRKISKSDLEELAKLMVDVYNAPPWNNKRTVETALESLTDISDFPKFFGNVIIDGDKIIGALIGHIRRYATELTFYIDEFFISEEYRGTGLAKELYQTSIKQLQQRGISGAFFTTLKNSQAYNFYAKQGAWDLEDSACFYHKF
ncbi:GNAT family N-acetyltransferase [Anaerococcus degeneri]|uniref:GNAT family N-acetyltransferase n=1 Tax=Anaerococcus degeneri TaxID=361500 RepID=A0ABS7YUQ4_9FIRM|nr:GNAT family N-acetyltransferase [Anaerococcus degeneri]MBP2015202.1 GNAT superfamily N-acetyltransferase [Anaerococcus degeneri]MCA2095460.1 GNAT family N-acetyltransferase [Anaerococcus degeneri]